ncbi:hypothetical protein BX600DRAFT_461974 [Xylariales sp. PMI_506]|nr:hypothetical protein BX600DRAFT_461974 [Xylariales sp. PMI_506]
MESTAAEQLPPAYKPRGAPQPPPPRVVRNHTSTFWLLFFFIPLLLIPWVVTCLLNFRPLLGASSYSANRGTVSESGAQSVSAWYRANQTLTMIAAIITIPVVAIVLSHAAVVMIQRRRKGKQLTALEMLNLVDAPWSRLSWGSKSPSFIIWAWALIAIVVLRLIVQAAVVIPEQIQLATILDIPTADSYSFNTRYSLVGYDPYVSAVNSVPLRLVSQDLAGSLSSPSYYPYEPNLWIDQSSEKEQYFPDTFITDDSIYDALYNGRSFFASALSASTDTGVLRYHAMRLNSSISCQSGTNNITFPETCSGTLPFQGDTTFTLESEDLFHVRFCVPGAYNISPWPSTRDRANVTEDMYINIMVPAASELSSFNGGYFARNFTMHCTAETTRGFFELPNVYNQHQPGVLLQNWPSVAEIAADYNDVSENHENTPLGDTDTEESSWWWPYVADPYSEEDMITPGPLMTSMLTLLGNESWYHLAQNQSLMSNNDTAAVMLSDICSRGLPLLAVGSNVKTFGNDNLLYAVGKCSDLDSVISRGLSQDTIAWMAYYWFTGLADDYSSALPLAMFYANRATLVQASSSLEQYLAARQIYRSPGVAVIKPSVPLAGLIIVSALLAVEVLALVCLAIFIYRQPTFASRVDAKSTAMIGAQLFATGVSLPHLGFERTPAALQGLKEAPGLIGVHQRHSSGAEVGPDQLQDTLPSAHSPRTSTEDQQVPSNPQDIELNTLGTESVPLRQHAFEAPSGCLVLDGQGFIENLPKPVPRYRGVAAAPATTMI